MVIRDQDLNRYNKSNKVRYNIDLQSLDSLCKYVVQDSGLVRMEHLTNLRQFMNLIDPEEYENDNEKLKRVRFIYKALEARIDNNIIDRNLIFIHINGGISFKIDFIDYDNLDMSRDDVLYVTNLVSDAIKYKSMYQHIDEITRMNVEMQSRDFMHRGNMVPQFANLLDRTNNEFRKAKIDDSFVETKFSLAESVFKNSVTNIYNMITNPSRRLVTGMQGLNKMVGGGFEAGRVYMFLGAAGVGKSLTLLNIMKQIKDYNTRVKTKDPTKIPCVLMLTMENTIQESVQRLYAMAVGDAGEMGDHELDTVISQMQGEGGLTISEASPIDLQMVYKANRSVNTSYLDSICDDLLDEGYEVICLIQDHVKRIRSIEQTVDLRIELGNVVNEMKSFAAARDIPVITVSHLNREAARTIEEAARKANQEIGRLLGKSNIGESMLMIDNIDCGIIIVRDYDKQGRPYMVFNAIKQRTKSELSYFAQPYMMDSTSPTGFGIRLQEDFGSIPCYRDSLHGAPELNQHSTVKITGASSLTANINDVLDISEDDRRNGMFASQSYKLSHSDNPAPIPDPYEVMNDFDANMQDIKNDINHFAKLQDSKVEFGRLDDDNDYSSPIIKIDEIDYDDMAAEFEKQKEEFKKIYGVGA